MDFKISRQKSANQKSLCDFHLRIQTSALHLDYCKVQFQITEMCVRLKGAFFMYERMLQSV
jgi:hypothetical protein